MRYNLRSHLLPKLDISVQPWVVVSCVQWYISTALIRTGIVISCLWAPCSVTDHLLTLTSDCSTEQPESFDRSTSNLIKIIAWVRSANVRMSLLYVKKWCFLVVVKYNTNYNVPAIYKLSFSCVSRSDVSIDQWIAAMHSFAWKQRKSCFLEARTKMYVTSVTY